MKKASTARAPNAAASQGENFASHSMMPGMTKNSTMKPAMMMAAAISGDLDFPFPSVLKALGPYP